MSFNDFQATKEELAEEKRIKANRESIVKTLEDLKYQTSRHICQNTGLSIDDVLQHIETDEEIRYQLVGGLTVYYLSKNTPK